jgi:hypothetical protein
MKMQAFSFDHPEQRRSRDRFRIRDQGLLRDMLELSPSNRWALKQVQGDQI